MALPNVTREQLLAALTEFDASGQRATYKWDANRYVVVHGGLHYPPKIIVSLATGYAVSTFSGGKAGANGYLARRGFEIIDLAEVGREALRLDGN